jgi:hypothetical protein
MPLFPEFMMAVESNPVPHYLSGERTDELARMILTLTSELWQLKDRTLVLEQLLLDSGVLSADAIDQFQPGGEFSQHLLEERRALTRRVMGAIAPSPERLAAEMAARKAD